MGHREIRLLKSPINIDTHLIHGYFIPLLKRGPRRLIFFSISLTIFLKYWVPGARRFFAFYDTLLRFGGAYENTETHVNSRTCRRGALRANSSAHADTLILERNQT